jgi:L-lactate permease
LKDFLFLLEEFLKIIFLHGEIFEFPYFFFCLKIVFHVNGKAIHIVTHPLFLKEMKTKHWQKEENKEKNLPKFRSYLSSLARKLKQVVISCAIFLLIIIQEVLLNKLLNKSAVLCTK